ncbi:phage tail tip lysozyme [Tianweitania sp.]|uniref:phage tail tip lysozyme n=1 Tax=Tianweitania sp. TaxID=2021634 RepID=UPI0028962D1D|nr:phage tail tip lysozyme [Tianweitania sp.]
MTDVSALRVLRVQAEMDAATYQAGAAGKVAADDAMVASGKRVENAVVQTDTTISSSENAVARLSRRYIEGFAAQESFGRGLAQIDRGLATGRMGMDQASLLIAGMTQRLGQHANASEYAARGQHQLAAAVASANARLEEQAIAANRSRTAQQIAPQPANQNADVGSPAQGFNTANVAAQFQDIVVTSAMGMSPLQIALQQGTQLSAVLGNQGAAGAARTLGAALLSVISPVSLLTIGAVAASAAFIQWVSSGSNGIETLDKAAARHRETLEGMKGAYAGLKIEAQSLADVGGSELLVAVGRQNKALNDALMRQQGSDLLSGLGSNVGSDVSLERLTKLDAGLAGFQPAWTKLLDSVRQGRADFDGFDQSVNDATRSILAAANASGDYGAGAMAGYGENVKALGRQLFDVGGKFSPFSDQISRLSLGLAEGNPDLAAFNDEIAQIGKQPGLEKLADEAILLGQELAKVIGFTRELQQAQGQLLGMGRGESSGRQEEYNRMNRESLFYMGRQFDAEFASIGARSPADLAAAARRREEARPVDPANENYEVRNLRIEQAGKMALAQAENQLKLAQEDRLRSLNATVDAQQQEVALIGQTTAAAAQLRMQYDLTARLREEAARNGVSADQSEIDAIRQKAAAYGMAVAQQEALSTINSQRDQIELGRIELSNLNLIGPARERAMDAAKAEIDIRKMGIDAYGQEASAIRANVSALSDLREAKLRADVVNDVRFQIEQMGRSPTEASVARQLQGTGIGMDDPIAGTLREMERVNRLRDSTRMFFDDMRSGLTSGDSIGDAIKQSIVRSLSNVSDKLWDQGMEAVMRAFFPAPTAPAAATAFTPTINGFASMMLGGGAANQNTASGPSSVNSRTMSGSVAEQAWTFFKGRGLSDVGAAAMLGQAHAESGFNPNAIGDNGAAFGLFQHHAARGGGRALLGQGVQGQLEHAWRELETSERGTLAKLQSATNVRDATRAAIGFERPQGWSAANPEGGHNFLGRLDATQQALSRFGGTTEAASKALDKVSTGAIDATKGLGQLGNNLVGAFPAAPAAPGGGVGGWLSNLFGGGATRASMSAISPMASSYISGAGGVIKGLFSEGGYTGDGGVFDPAGVVHRGEVVWSQRDIARAGGVGVVEGMRRSGARPSGGPASGPVEVHVVSRFEADGGFQSSVERVVDKRAPQHARQAASNAVQANNDEMPRSGFGYAQRRHTAMRG